MGLVCIFAPILQGLSQVHPQPGTGVPTTCYGRTHNLVAVHLQPGSGTLTIQ